MKKILTLLFVVVAGALLCLQCTKDKLIPITTSSEKARALYVEAKKAYEDVYFEKFVDLDIKALQEDPDFFMANYYMAVYSLYFKDDKRFREYAKRASECKVILSKGEILMKDAISQLLLKNDSDVTSFGKKLVKLYPRDVEAYYQLNIYQWAIKDFIGQSETQKKALDIAPDPAPVYNAMGYTYMNLGKKEEAAAAFDKYIELAPSLPNPYDSKGDYYLFVKDYRKAYECFMKANVIDSTWSLSKAMNAKSMVDSLGL